MLVQSMKILGGPPLPDSTPFGPEITSSRSSEVATIVTTMSRSARSAGESTIVAPAACKGSALERVRLYTAISQPAPERRSAIG
jgi:predicted Zn-ribbon and HTH transcriptional regulator